MPLTESDYKAQVLIEAKDDGTINTQWAFIWEYALYQAKDVVSDTSPYLIRLQYQYALVKACDTMLGRTINSVDASDVGQSVKADQLTKHRQDIRAMALSAIETLTKQASRQGHQIASGVMTKTAPVVSPAGYPDANSDYYRGNPQIYGPGISQG